MSFQHAVVWLDHIKAQVMHFDLNEVESEFLKTHSTHPHPHLRHSNGREDDNSLFFRDIGEVLKDATEILVVGPGDEKTAFVTHLTAHFPLIAARIKAVETVDHPTDGQLLAHARKYFSNTGSLHK